jgi:pimeloyl-ACP methyl ester carboxylesterase
MTTYVLVPGAWLGAWAWSDVATELRARGHVVHAVTLTGLAERAAEMTADTDLSTHVRDVVAVFEALDLRDVVLVGHSYAGAVIGEVAQLAADRIDRLVYLAAVVLPDGTSMFDLFGTEAAAGMEAMAVAAGDPHRLPVPSDAELDRYYGAHGLDAKSLAGFRAAATGHPIGTFRQAASLKDPAVAGLPRTYIRATADGPVPIGADSPGWEYGEIETGHWPMFTRPAELVELLERFAATRT